MLGRCIVAGALLGAATANSAATFAPLTIRRLVPDCGPSGVLPRIWLRAAVANWMVNRQFSLNVRRFLKRTAAA